MHLHPRRPQSLSAAPIIAAPPPLADQALTVLAERQLPGYRERLVRYRVEPEAHDPAAAWANAYLLLGNVGQTSPPRRRP